MEQTLELYLIIRLQMDLIHVIQYIPFNDCDQRGIYEEIDNVVQKAIISNKDLPRKILPKQIPGKSLKSISHCASPAALLRPRLPPTHKNMSTLKISGFLLQLLAAKLTSFCLSVTNGCGDTATCIPWDRSSSRLR